MISIRREGDWVTWYKVDCMKKKIRQNRDRVKV